MHRLLPLLIFFVFQAGWLSGQTGYMVVSGQPGNSVAGQVIAGAPSVTLYDSDDNPLGEGTEVTVALNQNDFTAGSVISALTDAGGVATFSSLIIETAAEFYEITFSSAGLDDESSDLFEVEAADPDYMDVTLQPADTIQGYPISGPPTITLYDEFDNPVEGIDITATLNKNDFSAGSTVVTITDGEGNAIFGNLVIDDQDSGYEITFSADDIEAPTVTDVTTSQFEIYEELAVIIVSNQPVSSTAGSTIEGEDVINPPTVLVENMSGVPQEGITITAELIAGSFAAGSTTTAITNSSGLATFGNLLIDDAGTGYRLVYSTGTNSVANAFSNEFDVVAVTGVMTIHQQPAESVEGYPVAGPPAVYIEEGGIPLENIEVTAYLNMNDFSGTSQVIATTNSSGIAHFGNLVIETAGTGYRIFFKSDQQGVASVASGTFDVVEEVAVLSVATQPLLTVAGERVNGPPAVLITSVATGNPVPSVNIFATLSGGDFTAGSTLMATTNASGIATFTNLVIDDAGTGYEIIFSTGSSGVADLASGPFDVVAVTGDMTIDVQPGETVSGYPVAGPPQVTITGLDGITPMSGIEVTAILNKSGFVSGTAMRITDGDGSAVFDDLVIDDVDTGYTILFSVSASTGVVSVASGAFDVVEEVAVLSVTTQPLLTVAGERVNGSPAVLITSVATGNPVPSVNIFATLSGGDFAAGSTLMATTNASGIATFTNLVIDDAGTGYEIIFSTGSSGVADLASGPFDVVAVTGDMTIDVQPGETVSGYPVAGPPQVTITGLDGITPMSGIEVTAILNKSGFVSGTVMRITDGDGSAVFDDLVIDDVDTGYTILFSVSASTGVASTTSAAFRVVTEVAIITVSQQPELTIEGERINGPPTVLLETTGGVPVQGGQVFVSLNKGGFAAGSTTSATTNASGVAVFDNLVIDLADTDYELLFTTGSSGIAGKSSDPFDVVEPLGLMVITQQPMETVNGYPVAGPPRVTITEVNGDPWAGDEVTINVSVNKNGFSLGTLSRVTVSGVATFDNLVLSAIDTGYELTFSVDISERIAGRVSNPFNVVAVAGSLQITVQPSETVEGDPINGPPTVRLTNNLGNPVQGVLITVTLNKAGFAAGSTLTATTNAGGYAVFSNLVIDDFDSGYRLTFSAGVSGIANVTSDAFEITDASLTMQVTGQPGLSTAGTLMSGPPEVTITDSEGGVSGIQVTAYINKNSFTGGSTLTATTDASGIAVFSNLVINTADQGYIITFNADFSGVPNAQSDPFTVTAAAPSYISVTVQPQNTVAGEFIAGPPSATVFDQFGNSVSGVEVTVEPNQHAGTFTGTTGVISDENGISVFSDLVQTRAAQNYSLLFSSPGITTGNSGTFSITSGPVNEISITTQPSESVAGAAISGPPVIAVLDQFNNPVSGVTVTISEEGGYSIDEGTLELVTPANGILTFSNLVINTAGTGYRFRFSTNGINELSNSFNVVPGTIYSRFHGISHSGFTSFEDTGYPLGQIPHRIEILTQPQESVVGDEMPGPPLVVVYDELDNPVTGVEVTVSGASFSAGSLTRFTNLQGEIAWDGMIIDIAGTYNLTFTADDYPGVTAESLPFDVIDAIATMTIVVQPAQTIAGQPVAGHPTLEIRNSIGMPLPGVSISVYVNQYGFASGTETVVTDMNGRAVFDDLVLNTASGGYQLIFDADYSGVANITSAAFSVVNAPAQSMNILTQPSETLEGSAITGPPTVLVADEFGNPAAGVNVTVSEIIAGTIDAGITTLTTNSSGIAAFSTLIINQRGTYQLSFTSSGITDVTSSTFQVISGTVANRFRGGSHSGFISGLEEDNKLGQTPVRIEITGQPAETVSGFVVEGNPRIIVYDEIDNPVANVQVTVSLLTGSFSSGTTTRTTNDDGEISFNNLVVSDPGTYRLSFRADNHTATVNDVESALFDVIGQIYFMQIESEPLNSIAGQPVDGPPVVSITNFIYQPLAGVDITVYINQHGFASGSVTVQTDEFGDAVFSDLVINTADENYQLIFDADYSGITNVSSAFFDVANADASILSITTQPQTTFEGAAISGPPTITLTDEFGNPVAGEMITVTETGGYTFDAGTLSTVTDIFGRAVFDDLIIETFGEYGLTFSMVGLPDANSVIFNVTSGTVVNRFRGSTHSGFISGAENDLPLGQVPVRIEVVSQPLETVVGAVIEGPPQVRVFDAFDNPVNNIGITVTTSTAFSSGTVERFTGSDGTVTFNDLVLDLAGTYQLTFSVDNVLYPLVGDALSALFEVVDPQLFLTVQTQPSQTVAGQSVAGPPSVRLANAIGQGFEGVDITVYINQFGFSSAPSTQTVTTNAGGIALFDALVIDVAATGYQLIFDAAYSGVGNITSGSFNVISSAADNISIITQPGDTESGSAITGPPAVLVSDEFGNPVSGVAVTVSESGGYTFDSGTLSQTTGADGRSVFDDLIIDNFGEYSLTFSASGVPDAVSAGFRVISGTVVNRFRGNTHSGFISDSENGLPLGQVPVRIEVVSQPLETVVGAVIEGPPQVRVFDAFDNPVNNIGITVTTSTAFSSGSVERFSGADGTATFNDLVLDLAGTYQLTFTASSYPGVTAQSGVFEVIDQVLTMSVQTQPSETVAGEFVAGPPSVRLTNSIGQGYEGANITVYINQFSFSSAPATQTVTTNASGIALFDALVIDAAAVGYQLIFDADYSGVANAVSEAFDVIAAAPYGLSITRQPADSETGSAIGGPPSARVNDEFGNPVDGAIVTVTETGGYSFDSGTVSLGTTGEGVAVFEDLVINTIGQYSLTFEVAGLPAVTSFMFNISSGTITPRFRGNTHSGFISVVLEDQILMDESCSAEIFLHTADDFVCQGENYSIRVSFTGEAPYTFTYNDGYQDIPVVTSDNPHIIEINAVWEGVVPTRVYNYTIIEVSDNRGCVAGGTGSVEVTVYKRPETGPMYNVPNTID